MEYYVLWRPYKAQYIIWYSACEYIPSKSIIPSNVVLVAPSRFVADMIHRAYGVKPIIIPHGVNPDDIKYDSQLVEKIRRKYGEFILYVGSNIKRKGVGYLIKAVEYLYNDGVKVNLVLITSYPSKAMWSFYKPYIIPSKPYIHVIDTSNDRILDDITLHSYYRACSVYVQPSLQEGFGIPVVEAGMHDKPVVLAPFYTAFELSPKWYELRVNNITHIETENTEIGAFIYNHYNPKDLAEKIWTALNNQDITLREYVLDNFNISVYDEFKEL